MLLMVLINLRRYFKSYNRLQLLPYYFAPKLKRPLDNQLLKLEILNLALLFYSVLTQVLFMRNNNTILLLLS
jgi:hypothetical protein